MQETKVLFANSLLLLGVYMWYDTIRMIIKRRMPEENEVGWIFASLILSGIVIYLVLSFMKDEVVPHPELNPQQPLPPPPNSRKIDLN